MKDILNDMMNMEPRFDTFGDNLYWAYATWQAIFATAKASKHEFDRSSFFIRSGCFKRLKDGKAHITDLYKLNDAKVKAGCHCFYCRKMIPKEDLTLDHVFPRVKGGENNIDNIIYVCKSCNSSKGKRELLEWFLLYRNELPPVFVLGHYLRQINAYADENNLKNLSFAEVCQMDLPFNPRSILILSNKSVCQQYISMAMDVGGNDWEDI